VARHTFMERVAPVVDQTIAALARQARHARQIRANFLGLKSQTAKKRNQVFDRISDRRAGPPAMAAYHLIIRRSSKRRYKPAAYAWPERISKRKFCSS